MLSLQEKLNRIRNKYDMIIKCQKHINESYEKLNSNNYDNEVNNLKGLCKTHNLWLNELTEYLDDYFNINSKWSFNHFRIKQGWKCYIIKPPKILPKTSKEYVLLKELLVKLHKKYSLCNGGISYAFTRVEDHMWEIDDNTKDTELINKLMNKSNRIGLI